jgi:hypothetical protein
VIFPHRNDPIEAFVFDRADEALRVRIRVGRTLENEHHLDPRVLESTRYVTAPLAIPIANQDVWRVHLKSHRTSRLRTSR